ncbi:hypothetical protein AB6A40_005668 [Gnathostoma spinigerum]|uniref:Uncharacterized protein n=1 Tax=Gnathostoma spinigerum TaxID=75299 RepID=A0ABD6EG40_9BILA
MSVVGFDFGNYNCYIAVARGGGIEVLTNDYSLHGTPSCVSFGHKNRVMGVAAEQQLNTNVKNTIINFKHLIGRKYSDPITQALIPFIPCTLKRLNDDHIGLEVQFLNETRVFLPEQIVAALFCKLKQITAANLKDVKRVTDCVVSVPFYFTDTQRRCLLDAIKMADLNCLRIMNETTATALAYGIYKQDLPIDGQAPPRIVGFVDVGHMASQAAIVSFHKGKLKVLGTSYSLHVGGLAFDAVLRDHFCQLFKEKYKIDASKNTRAWVRLLNGCEKLKKQMSANSTKIPINVECLMNDIDVTGQMERSEFEELAAPLFEKLRAMLKNLLADCGVKPEEIHSVEIVGGSSRIPAVKKVIAEVFGKDPMTTMNQDEAIARGAAMECAILSPSFRVKEFSIKDSQPYCVKLTWESINGGEGGDSTVFVERDEFPFSKMITLNRYDPFRLTACYAFPNQIPHLSREIGTWVVKGVTPCENGEPRKVKVKVRINPSGVFLVCSANTYDTIPLGKDDVKKEEVMEVDKKVETTNEDQPMPPEEEAQNVEGEKQWERKGVKSDEKGVAEAEKGPKTKTIINDLPIEEKTTPFLDAELLRREELEFEAIDRREKERADAKNAVEEYVYYMRDKLCDSFAEFITPRDAEDFKRLLSSTEDWLYGEGEDTEKKIYEARLAELRKYGDPVQERYYEFCHRQEAYDSFDQAIMRARKAYEDYQRGGAAYAHLESKDMEKVIAAVTNKKMWLDQERAKQERKGKTETPSIFISQIRQEQQAFENVVNPILSKPKPTPPPKKEEKKETKKEAKSNGASLNTNPKATPADAPAGDSTRSASSTVVDDMDID